MYCVDEFSDTHGSCLFHPSIKVILKSDLIINGVSILLLL